MSRRLFVHCRDAEGAENMNSSFIEIISDSRILFIMKDKMI